MWIQYIFVFDNVYVCACVFNEDLYLTGRRLNYNKTFSCHCHIKLYEQHLKMGKDKRKL